MPFNAIPLKDFVNREAEINYLKHLSVSVEVPGARNILLEAERGMGKTELLRQLHRIFFWEGGHSIPFYYSFQTSALKANHFAKDYFSRFLRQYLACVKKDPSLADNMLAPLSKLVPVMHSLGMGWMADVLDDFQEHLQSTDPRDHILAALSAPLAAAARGGRPIIIMLDDFPMATRLFETIPGDISGPISLFDDVINAPLCRHILTGSPENVLESTFTDKSLRGKAERIFIGPLPEDAAHFLFGSLCEKLGMRDNRESSLKFMNFLGGNPHYIINIAKSLRKMQKKEVTERDLWECYSYEVAQGETFFYWSSVLDEFVGNGGRRIAAKLLMQSLQPDVDMCDAGVLSKVLGIPQPSLAPVLEALNLSGMIRPPSERPKDHVLKDFIRSLHMMEVEGVSRDRARESIQSGYFPGKDVASRFEMVIPMTSDSELVAAKAVEQIGKNANLGPDVTDRLQLAVIESCINAVEHSGSYDKRIFLTVSLHRGRLEIIIESPGKPFQPDMEEPSGTKKQLSSGDKRGHGLKLMGGIMDDVRIERLADRTRVIMIKNIKPSEVSHESS